MKFKVWQAVVIVAAGVVVVLLNAPVAYSPVSDGPDSQRLSDLSAVKTALGFYRAETGSPYPAVSGDTPEERWRELESILLGMEMPPLSAIPWDPENVGDFYYDYQASPTGEGFVVRAKFSSDLYRNDKEHSPHRSDIDGNHFGIDCGDPNNDTIYCVGVLLNE